MCGCLASALTAAEGRAGEAAGAAAQQVAKSGFSAESLDRLLAEQRRSTEHDKAAALAQLKALHASEVPPPFNFIAQAALVCFSPVEPFAPDLLRALSLAPAYI